ncbi:hypothetical protein PG984_011358 [Apiospora sp. TS-2023a]
MLAHLALLVTGGLFASLSHGSPVNARSSVGCTFHLSVNAGGDPPATYPVGQIDDGLCRARGDLEASTFTWFGDAFKDQRGRGCWWTPPTSVLQCDPSQQLSHGFDLGCHGNVSFSGQSTFFACKTDDSANIYLEPNGAQCQPVTLVADGCQSTCYDPDPHPLIDGNNNPPFKDCPANIIWSPYEKPQLMVPVDRSNPSNAYGPTYLGQVSQNFSTVYNVEIPSAYDGKSCKLAASNGTESYYFAGSGGVAFARLGKPASLDTTWEDVFGDSGGISGSSNGTNGITPLGQTQISPGHSYVVDRFACPAGSTLTYLITEPNNEDTYLVYLQNDVPVALGLFMSVC